MKLFLSLIIFISTASVAHAADFGAVITDELTGKPMCMDPIKPEETCPAGRYATLGFLARNALGATYQDERDVTGDEKYHRGEIAKSIRDGGVDLNSTDLALIKKLIGKAYTPTIVRQAWDLIDPPKDNKK